MKKTGHERDAQTSAGDGNGRGRRAPAAWAAAAPERIRAVAFDGFPIFDSRPVVALAKELYPEIATSKIQWSMKRINQPETSPNDNPYTYDFC